MIWGILMLMFLTGGTGCSNEEEEGPDTEPPKLTVLETTLESQTASTMEVEVPERFILLSEDNRQLESLFFYLTSPDTLTARIELIQQPLEGRSSQDTLSVSLPPVIASGMYQLEMFCRDAKGNASLPVIYERVEIQNPFDVEAPVLSLESPGEGLRLSAGDAFEITGEARDDAAVLGVFMSVADWIPPSQRYEENPSPGPVWRFSRTVNVPPDAGPGTYMLEVYAADDGGNLSETTRVEVIVE